MTSGKGHDVLLGALATISDLTWECVCVGSLDRDPAFVAGLRRRSADGGLDDRVSFPGARTGAELDRSYAAADLLVLASRGAERRMARSSPRALACGLPVIRRRRRWAHRGAGARRPSGIRPGLLVAPEDPAALGDALRAWLGDAPLRARLRHAARERRETLPEWSTTASVMAGVLDGASR